MADARVNVVVTGARRALDALRGITRTSEQSAAQQGKAANKAAQLTEQAEKTKRKSHKRTADEEKLLLRGRLQEARRFAREQMRLSRQTAQAQVEDQKRVEREGRRRGRGFGAAAIGGLAGAAGGVGAAASRHRGIAGVRSQEERIQSAAEFQVNLARLGVQADLSNTQRDALGSSIVDTSTRYGLDQGELLTGIGQAQERFGTAGFKELSPNLERFAKASVALGAPMEDIIGMMGTFQSAMGLSSEEVGKALDFIVAGAREGSIEIKDFSNSFAGEIGSFAQTTGLKGMGGVQTFVGLSQAIGAGQFGAAESATRLRAATVAMQSGASQENLAKFLKKQGHGDLAKSVKANEANPLAVIQALAKTGDAFTKNANKIFTENRAAAGVLAAVGEERKALGDKDNAAASRIAQLDSSVGAGVIDKSFGAVAGTKGFRFSQLQSEAQATITENLDSYADVVIRSVETTNELEKKFGSLTMATEVLEGAFIGIAGGSLLSKLAGGGTAVTKMGPAAIGKTAAGNAGRVGMVGAAAAAGYFGTDWLLEKTGAKGWLESGKLFGKTSGENEVEERWAKRQEEMMRKQLEQSNQQTQALKSVNETLKNGGPARATAKE